MVEATTAATAFEVPSWLLPDTEESVLGTQWHQEAIDPLATILVEVGRRHGASWGVARGIFLHDTGARYPNGTAYDPKPDVMVLPRPLPDEDVAGVSLSDTGAPLFVAEVASRSTLGNDLAFKKDVYEFAGVREYIAFDAAGYLIAPALHAWRLDGDTYVPWSAAEDGWWHSEALEITFRPTQPFMTIRDRDGRTLSLPRRTFEREQLVEQLAEELAEAQRRIAEMEEQLRQRQDDEEPD